MIICYGSFIPSSAPLHCSIIAPPQQNRERTYGEKKLTGEIRRGKSLISTMGKTEWVQGEYCPFLIDNQWKITDLHLPSTFLYLLVPGGTWEQIRGLCSVPVPYTVSAAPPCYSLHLLHVGSQWNIIPKPVTHGLPKASALQALLQYGSASRGPPFRHCSNTAPQTAVCPALLPHCGPPPTAAALSWSCYCRHNMAAASCRPRPLPRCGLLHDCSGDLLQHVVYKAIRRSQSSKLKESASVLREHGSDLIILAQEWCSSWKDEIICNLGYLLLCSNWHREFFCLPLTIVPPCHCRSTMLGLTFMPVR